MPALPIAPSCALDRDGLRAQRERYRRAGEGARVRERGARRIVVDLAGRVDAAEVEELVAVERACCPFFELDWNAAARRLQISVSRAADEPALDAVAFALGIDG